MKWRRRGRGERDATFPWRLLIPLHEVKPNVSSNGCHYGPIFFKPEKNLEFFRLKNWPIDGYPGKLE